MDLPYDKWFFFTFDKGIYRMNLVKLEKYTCKKKRRIILDVPQLVYFQNTLKFTTLKISFYKLFWFKNLFQHLSFFWRNRYPIFIFKRNLQIISFRALHGLCHIPSIILLFLYSIRREKGRIIVSEKLRTYRLNKNVT